MCKLPPALSAEWPGSFMCHCGNMGMEQTPNKILSMQKSLTINMYSSCLSEVSLMLHLNWFQYIYLYVDLQWPYLDLAQSRVVKSWIFLCFSPSEDWWPRLCPMDWVSSSPTLWIFWNIDHLWGLHDLPTNLSALSLFCTMDAKIKVLSTKNQDISVNQWICCW